MILDPDGPLSAHLAAAVRRHRRRLDPRTVPLSVLLDLARLERLFGVRAVQGGSSSVTAPDNGHLGGMTLLLTYREAAEALAVSEATVKRLVRSGDLRPVKVASSPRISPDELVAYVERLRQPVPVRAA